MTQIAKRRKTGKAAQFIAKPTKEDIDFEIGTFLRHPWDWLADFGTNSFGWMANVRPQLLFYGKSPNGTASYDRYLTRDQVLQWIHGKFELKLSSLTPRLSGWTRESNRLLNSILRETLI